MTTADHYPALLRRVLGGDHLTASEAADVIGGIMDETISPVRAAALLAALAAKGEDVDEIVGAARAMRERSIRVDHGLPLVVDIVGTGGDGAHTINISTAAAFIVAGTGVKVAKHGNRAASSLCGSADVLEALGVPLDRGPDASARILREGGICFLFAQRHHPAMRVVGPIRRELGVRTIFNVLGPLTNPAGANRQVVGVARAEHVDLVASALRALGAEAGAVIHADDGLDEISGDAPTQVAQFDRDGVRRWTLDPSCYGVHAPATAIRGGDVAVNAAALLAILEGERSPRADLVLLNAALALVVAGEAVDIDDGIARARTSVETGRARAALDALRGERDPSTAVGATG
ncbi:anthranilate phosphoribosyltransferase [Vulcanimicrobium alpinum]|uniref:Anthranilate phosphoribosyltransferase n=1 Tax=Vulcanimicrobium alpinum TaxID=3016050 RepID=A0AAN1XXG6_UNVUL|nr:anthranilate phosphoribosyltransferase [Vulcanimicrobium alpinum]BDE06729.1 anthranilate phosphoribosyltransferase [Vulcanimicrobium alpinum]